VHIRVNKELLDFYSTDLIDYLTKVVFGALQFQTKQLERTEKGEEVPQVRRTKPVEGKLIELRNDGVVEVPKPLCSVTMNDKTSQVGEVDCVEGPAAASGERKLVFIYLEIGER
jgi:hypothetical protein